MSQQMGSCEVANRIFWDILGGRTLGCRMACVEKCPEASKCLRRAGLELSELRVARDFTEKCITKSIYQESRKISKVDTYQDLPRGVNKYIYIYSLFEVKGCPKPPVGQNYFGVD